MNLDPERGDKGDGVDRGDRDDRGDGTGGEEGKFLRTGGTTSKALIIRTIRSIDKIW